MIDEFLKQFADQFFSPERFNVAIISLILIVGFGLCCGSLGGNSNPFLWGILDLSLGRFARKTYKVDRSLSSLHFRGGIILVLYIVIAGTIAAGAVLAIQFFPLSGFMEPILLAFALNGGAVWRSIFKLHKAISATARVAEGSFYDIAVSTRTNLNTTDHHGIIRVGIAYMAISFDKGLVAPLFWYLVGGVPAAFVYAGVAGARWAIAKDGFAKGIGVVALKLEWLAGCIPQLLSTALLALSALAAPKARMTRVLTGVFAGGGGRAPYAEGGLPLTAFAWGLGVSLGGPVEDSDGSVLKHVWVGASKSTAKVEIYHLRIALYWNIISYLLVFFGLLAGEVVWRLLNTQIN